MKICERRLECITTGDGFAYCPHFIHMKKCIVWKEELHKKTERRETKLYLGDSLRNVQYDMYLRKDSLGTRYRVGNNPAHWYTKRKTFERMDEEIRKKFDIQR